jgi:F420-0:gamma-glutamyl ligase
MRSSLNITPIQTGLFHLNDNLNAFLKENLKPNPIKDGDVLAITSKIVSLAEGQVVNKNSIDKISLIKREADYDLGDLGYGSRLTIKHGMMIPSAGIDESNSENAQYILFPKNPFLSARNIYQHIAEEFNLNKFGIIITDSRTMPLRLGVTGIALSYYGFEGVRNLVGKKDLFAQPLKMTQVNIVDSLAVAAVLMMGEADESSPLAVIRNAQVQFTGSVNKEELLVTPVNDMYYPLYKSHLINNN